MKSGLDVSGCESGLAHAAVMGYQAMRQMIAHGEMFGVVVLAVIGVVLLALAPAKPATVERVGV